jgi:hypothetical protein
LIQAMGGEAIQVRLAEGDARAVLLIEAVEETDEHGALLAQAARAAAACGGALANAVGSERHVSVLAFPLAGILL